MNRPCKCALVVVSSLVVGAILFVCGFFTLDFVWTHFVVTDPKEIGLGDGAKVVGGGLIIGTTLGLVAVGCVLYRFWPAKNSIDSAQRPSGRNQTLV